MEAGEDGPQLHFAVHVDKAVMSTVKLASWSPKHEMLAVAFADRPLSLYRLNWERLWTVSPETVPPGCTVSALCWAPEGAVLAAGLSNGTIILLNVEDASVVHRFILKEIDEKEADVADLRPVLALGWVQGLDSSHQSTKFQFPCKGLDWVPGMLDGRLQKLFEPLGPKIPTKPMTIDEIYSRFEKKRVRFGRGWSQDPKGLNILVGASGVGHVILSAFGVVEIAELDTAEYAPHGVSLTTFQAAVTRDMRHLIIVQLVKRRKKADAGHLVAYIVDCSIIGNHSEEIRQLTQRMYKVTTLLKAAESTLRRAEQVWNEAASAVHSKLNLLSSELSIDDLVDMLLIFLVSGSMTKNMETILMENLTEHGLKRLADEVDTSLQLVNELVLGHLQVALEQCLFIVGELLGLARTQEVLSQSVLGTSIKDTLLSLQTELSWLFLNSEVFRSNLVDVETGYRLFFSFLLSASHQANDKHSCEEGALHRHAMAIKDFLQGELKADSIGPELSKMESKGGKSKTRKSEMAENLLGSSRWPNETLRGLLSKISLEWDKTFRMIKINLNKHNCLIQQVNLTTSGCRGLDRTGIFKLSLPQVPAETASDILQIAFCIDAGSGRDTAVILKAVLPSDAQPELSLTGGVICIPPGHSLADIGLRNNESVVLLLRDKCDSKGKLVVVNLKEVPFRMVKWDRGIAEELLSGRHVMELPKIKGIQERSHPHPGLCAPLAVSLESIASVFSAHRVVHYDLEAYEDMEI